jgi:long-chain acyl-CoA synthetase
LDLLNPRNNFSGISKDHVVSEDAEGRLLSISNISELASRFRKIAQKRSLVFCLCDNNLESLAGYLTFINLDMVQLLLDQNLDDSHFQSVEEYEGYVLCKFDYLSYKLHPNLILLLTTSGSTGSPKMVRLSASNLSANAKSISEYLKISKADRPITSLPFHYSYGLSVINSHLISGAKILMTNFSIARKEFWEFFRKNDATSFAGVPFSYEILDRIRFHKMDVPCLQTMTQAGGRLSTNLVKKFSDFCKSNNRRFFVMYGQTEATARISFLEPEMINSKLGSIGKSIPQGELSIDYSDNNSEQGELLYRGPNVSLGYANSWRDLANGDDNKGILRTGDLARVDDDGYFFITGRKKRFIKLFGNRINLDSVEQLAEELFGTCACSGNDQKLIVHHCLNTEIEEKLKLLSLKLGIHKSAIAECQYEELPLGGNGKIDYSRLSVN